MKTQRISPLKQQGGQLIVEVVLLLAIGTGLSVMAVNFLKDQKIVQNIFGKPWGALSGMIECGSWNGCQKGLHSGSGDRILSYKPDP